MWHEPLLHEILHCSWLLESETRFLFDAASEDFTRTRTKEKKVERW